MATSLQVVEQAMEGIPGLRITSTYRDPEKNRAVGGSPTSYHMRRSDPAVDVAGPEESLDRLASRLRSLGHDAELLWKQPGHYDHVHYALRDGASVGSDLPRFYDSPTVPSFQSSFKTEGSAISGILESLRTAAVLSTSSTGAEQPDKTLLTTGASQATTMAESGEGASLTTFRRPQRSSRSMTAAQRLRQRPKVGG